METIDQYNQATSIEAYEKPKCEIIEMDNGGILCASISGGPLDMDGEDW